ncbi:DUF1569 domain-containing protein [Edaphobacter bradus]|uniref:DUF1569 domain-containing protein n=1 Tax=Edaphobacter bradus TaxID=2259016 RepID=UPI0021E0F16B|nr:DUF1569 domain-containing protein [Edaphobacter bradus]
MKSLASAEVLSEMRGRLLRLRAEDRALWGKMTASQMARHLVCSCQMALGDRTMEAQKVPAPVVVKWVALRSGLRWPKNLATTPELARALEEPSEGTFDELVCEAIKTMEAVASGTHLAPRHPMFGTMSATDWMRWGYLHADHHLRQFGR